jgi:MoaA/NifB/PqqE/SkfB family radical SAM enzyme
MANYNRESFCPEAWSQIEVSMAGDYTICCLANYDEDFGMARDDNNVVMNVLTHSFEEALNSKTHREHRLQLSRGERPTRCRNCYDAEDSSKVVQEWRLTTGNKTEFQGRSKRQRVLNSTAMAASEYVILDTVEKYTDPVTGAVTSPIVNLHLRFGNLCNLQCTMCSPQHSNMWYDDWMNLYDKPFNLGKYRTFKIEKDQYGRNKLGFEKWWEHPKWWENFKRIMPQLRHIYFTGGEPFLVPALDTCLDLLIEAGLASKIVLRFDTNLTVFNQKILDKLKLFRRVALCVSVDETEERYHLIRNPGNYDRFLENLQKLIDNKIPIEYVSSCIGIATLYTIPRVCQMTAKYKVRPEFRFLEGPKWLDLRYLPRSAKEELIKYYESLPSENYLHIRWYKTMINLLNKYLDDSYTNYNFLNDFVKFMDKLDETRNTNWRTTLPDVCDLLRRHCDDALMKYKP